MDNFIAAFDMFFQFHVIAGIGLGVFLGIVLGSIPGLTATMAIALIIPMTFHMDPVVSVGLLVGAYKGGTYGGSIPAILLNTPGTPAASATLLDGFELAKQGKSVKALKAAIYSSVIGDTLSDLVLILVAPPLALIALKMGPPEMAALIFLSLLIITTVSGESMIKGIIVGSIGLIVGTIGLDAMTAVPRFGFDFPQLDEGVSLIPMLIGLFAVSEFLINTESVGIEQGCPVLHPLGQARGQPGKRPGVQVLRASHFALHRHGYPLGLHSRHRAFHCRLCRICSGQEDLQASGKIRQGIPGRGDRSRGGQQRGLRGQPDSPAYPGHPGRYRRRGAIGRLHDPGAPPRAHAVQAEYSHGLCHLHGTYDAANVFNFVIGMVYIKFASKVVLIPKSYIFPAVLAFCFFGAYGFNQSLFDVWMVIIFGLLGYLLRRNGFPLAPLLIAFILEPILESSFRQSLLISQGSLIVFVTHPISAVFLALSVLGVASDYKGDRQEEALARIFA
jgi:putative tricarboxylic transport membrane protein